MDGRVDRESVRRLLKVVEGIASHAVCGAEEFDAQGRVLIHPRLRDSAGMSGEVDVFGQYDYLDVWNHERFVAKMQREPFTDDDARALSEFGI